MLNPNLNFDQLRDDYAKDQRLRIDDVMDPTIADELRALCTKKVPFDFIYVDGGVNHVINTEQMKAMSPQDRRDLQIRINQQAAEGVGFLYGGYRLGKERTEIPEAFSTIEKVYEFFNSRKMLDAIETITGQQDLVDADAQMTRYVPGNFLTRHSDDIYQEGRRIAYVFSFTERWHPDWGGLLQFYEKDGTPRDAWIPGANTLSIFDVSHIHGVSYVAPYAPVPRLSMTGWFRGAKPEADGVQF